MSYGEYYCDHGIFAFYAHLPLTLDPSVPRIAITIIREQNETVPVHRLYVVVASRHMKSQKSDEARPRLYVIEESQ